MSLVPDKTKSYLNEWGSLSLRCHAHELLAKRLMHKEQLSGNTSGASKSSSDWLNYTGFQWPPNGHSMTLRLDTEAGKHRALKGETKLGN